MMKNKQVLKTIAFISLSIILLFSMTGCSSPSEEIALTNDDVITSYHISATKLNSNTFLHNSNIKIKNGVQVDERTNTATSSYDGKYINIGGIVKQTYSDSIVVTVESEYYGVNYSADITVYPIILNCISTFNQSDIVWILGKYTYSNFSISDAIIYSDDEYEDRDYSECISEAVEIDTYDFFYNDRDSILDTRIKLNNVYVGVVNYSYCIVWYDETNSDSYLGQIFESLFSDNRGYTVYFNDSSLYSKLKVGDWINTNHQ